MLITISRQFGTGGAEVARLVAGALGWHVVDNEIVDRVAHRAGLAPDAVAEQDERVPGFVERLARALAASSQEFAVPEIGVAVRPAEPNLVRLTEMVVKEIAAEGQAVLVGRAAPAVLGREAGVLHVKLVAGRDYRIEAVMASEKLDRRGAERLMDHTDAERRRYHREHYGRDWDDPLHYHMVLNTGLLGIEETAALIVSEARRQGW
ncbi:MAG: cytidylate kinase-like family protein [Gemmatimonadales bacterium]